MLKENKEVFDFLNITEYLEAGYTGKGSLVMLDSYSPLTDSPLKDFMIPFSNYRGDYQSVHPYHKVTVHPEMVASIIKQLRPTIKLYYGEANTSTFAYHLGDEPEIAGIPKEIPQDEVNVVTMSEVFKDREGNTLNQDFFGKYDELDYIKDKFYMFSGAGNDGKKGVQAPANDPDNSRFAVGACYLENGEIKFNDYSSVGPELDIMGLDHIWVETSKGKLLFRGTSCATPIVACMVDMFIEAVKDLNPYWRDKKIPTWLLQDTLRKESLRQGDLKTKGFDIETGYGLFKLPKLENLIYKQMETP